MRSLVGAFKLFVFFLSALVTFAVQGTILTFCKGPITLIYPRAYHAFACWLFGLKVVVEGDIDTSPNVVFAGNHISYLDVQAVGSIVKGCFIAKKEVESWPLFGALGKMGQTLYVSRNPQDAPKEIKAIADRAQSGIPIIVFPEGTSSDGTSIFPFKSSLFEIFLNKNIKIQPFTISLVEVHEENNPTPHKRDYYSWYGDMDFGPHLWRFAKGKGAVVKVIFQESVSTSCYTNRKSLSNDIYEAVCKGLDLSFPAQ